MKKEKYSLGYAKGLLSSTDVLAPRAGIVVFEDVFDWVGRPVSIGEKVMVLAKGDQTELELRLPVYDNIGITIDADVRFFSNANPDQPIKAIISHHSYRASTSDLGDVSYRLKAKWENTDHKSTPRIGLKGSAKVYGERKPFILHILRRPLVEVRQWLGM